MVQEMPREVRVAGDALGSCCLARLRSWAAHTLRATGKAGDEPGKAHGMALTQFALPQLCYLNTVTGWSWAHLTNKSCPCHIPSSSPSSSDCWG